MNEGEQVKVDGVREGRVQVSGSVLRNHDKDLALETRLIDLEGLKRMGMPNR